jgi:hypothetical protein
MTALREANIEMGKPRVLVESLFLMICESRIFTCAWGGLGEACLASVVVMDRMSLEELPRPLSPEVFACYLIVLKCILTQQNIPRERYFAGHKSCFWLVENCRVLDFNPNLA